MNITGIITEYNPFHLGHKLHLESARKDTNSDAIICIMSGNFMQRGMPSIIDKWNRAKIAIANGVDLVIELPLKCSISSAEGFASGAVSILESTGVVNNLYFGSEHGSITELDILASTIIDEPNEFKFIMKNELDKGLPFHTARKAALETFLPNVACSDILSNSNNILAIEYIKALKKINSNILPYTLKRAGANYNDVEVKSKFPSATSIRATLKNDGDLSSLKSTMPEESYKGISNLLSNNYPMIYPEDIFPFLKYKILTEGNKLSLLPEVREGLDNKIIKEIVNSNSLDELILKVKSKRYTYTRISRILTAFFIGLENYPNYEELSNYNYIRPLAFNEKGSKLLKEIKKKNNVSIITKIPKKIDNPLLSLDLLGTKAYSVLNNAISPYEDYLKSPFFLK
ncbi:nucleotidyltransferase [Clostridium sp. LP20]|uniref:nucleotidyltransferase n=1 Tax=Clostridium sp. LP20 TaxID=3418665 RepID=UPI003EE7DABC